MNCTEKYYKDNAQDFFDSTVYADVSPLYERFCKYITKGSRVLDFGCGSGRDTKAFMDMGYIADGIDGSQDLCKLASEYTGSTVRCMDFYDFNEEDKYDAIWACASLLHISTERLPEIIMKLRAALKNSGIMYISFKYGDYEGVRDGRYFNDMTKDKFLCLYEQLHCLQIEEEWYSEDVRRDKNVQWYNVIMRKVLSDNKN